MATVFWDSQGVIYINNLEKGSTATGFYYAELLGRFDVESWQRTGLHLRCRHGQIDRIALWTAVTFTVFSRFGPVRLFFPNLKKSLAGQKFESKEIIAAMEIYFEDLEKT